MDKVVDELATGLATHLQSLPDDRRYLIGIAGIPGSGKSTLAQHVCSAVNLKLNSSHAAPNPAVVVGMDGWHYSRETLATFEDPQHAKDRRGAAFTFNSKAFADFVERLQRAGDEAVRAPSFSHSVKDPVEDDVEISASHRLVIIEGLYCNCNDGEWARGAAALDERWVVQVDTQVARERLRIRHVQTGVAQDEQEALWRADNNDLPNGVYIMTHLLEPVKRIDSTETSAWA